MVPKKIERKMIKWIRRELRLYLSADEDIKYLDYEASQIDEIVNITSNIKPTVQSRCLPYSPIEGHVTYKEKYTLSIKRKKAAIRNRQKVIKKCLDKLSPLERGVIEYSQLKLSPAKYQVLARFDLTDWQHKQVKRLALLKLCRIVRSEYREQMLRRWGYDNIRQKKVY